MSRPHCDSLENVRLFPYWSALELASRPGHSWLDPNNCTHTAEGAVTANCTNVLALCAAKGPQPTVNGHYYKRYSYCKLYQCLNMQKVHFVLQKDTPGVCHNFYERPIWRHNLLFLTAHCFSVTTVSQYLLFLTTYCFLPPTFSHQLLFLNT